jgi:hypothetical protein
MLEDLSALIAKIEFRDLTGVTLEVEDPAFSVDGFEGSRSQVSRLLGGPPASEPPPCHSPSVSFANSVLEMGPSRVVVELKRHRKNELVERFADVELPLRRRRSEACPDDSAANRPVPFAIRITRTSEHVPTDERLEPASASSNFCLELRRTQMPEIGMV